MSAKKAQLSFRLREILSALVPKGHRKLASYEVAGKSSKKNLRPAAVRLKSGAKATAVQTLARLSGSPKFREASGLRRVHRRF
jgi:hypothetical protein